MPITVFQGDSTTRTELNSDDDGLYRVYVNLPPNSTSISSSTPDSAVSLSSARELEILLNHSVCDNNLGNTSGLCPVTWSVEVPASIYQRNRRLHAERQYRVSNYFELNEEIGATIYNGTGGSIAIRTSVCGSDYFTVRFLSRGSEIGHLNILTRKKIEYVYLMMRNGSPNNIVSSDITKYNLETYWANNQDILFQAKEYFLNQFSIEFVEGDRRELQHRNASWFAPQNSLLNYTRGVSNVQPVEGSYRPNVRQIFIISLDHLPNTTDGYIVPGNASTNIAAISLGYCYRRGSASQYVRAVLIHEIGHLLGLTPSSSGSPPRVRFGGQEYGSWGRSAHCNSRQCIMYPEVETPQTGNQSNMQLALGPRNTPTAFCGDNEEFPETGHSGNCSSFLQTQLLNSEIVYHSR
jgi:hypothetical protein